MIGLIAAASAVVGAAMGAVGAISAGRMQANAARYTTDAQWQRERLPALCSAFSTAAADAAREYLEALTPICEEDWALAERKVADLDLSSLRLTRDELELRAPHDVAEAAKALANLMDTNLLRQALHHREAPEGGINYMLLMLLALDNRRTEFVAAARQHLHTEEASSARRRSRLSRARSGHDEDEEDGAGA